MNHPPSFEEEPYDPSVDYEPPYRPERARKAIEHMYLISETWRTWWDGQLAELAEFAARLRAEAEAEPQMRLPLPWFCRWMYFEETIQRYAELKAQIK